MIRTNALRNCKLYEKRNLRLQYVKIKSSDIVYKLEQLVQPEPNLSSKAKPKVRWKKRISKNTKEIGNEKRV